MKVLDLGALVGVADVAEDGVGAGAAADDVLNVEVVEGVGGLEPGAAVVEVEVNGVGGGEGVVDAVEDVLFVALVVEDGELGGIEKAAGVEAVDLNEVAPVLAAIAEVEPSRWRSRRCRRKLLMLPVGLVTPCPERVVATMTRLVLSPYSAGGAPADDLDGLNGVGGELVGEDLALLVGDGLAIDGEGVGGVVAEAMEEAVGVGGDAGGGERDQGTERRRTGFRAEP